MPTAALWQHSPTVTFGQKQTVAAVTSGRSRLTSAAGYLAHIIASDPDGPRGTIAESHLLSNHPENIMLMCDAHHRLIDSFEPETYKAPRLQEMRREHTSMVRKYRDAMRFPVAHVMTLFADLGNIPTHFPDSEFMEALLAERFSMHPEVKRHLTYQGRDDRTPPDFWGNYLREMELPIRAMVQDLGRSTSADVLAVFPVHHTPTLVLAGRITGEARRVRVFQPSRARKSWLWDSNAAAHPAGTFKILGLTDTQADEVLLTVELTAHIDKNALPDGLAKAVDDGNMPWIRLTTDAPHGECIQRREDLEQVVNAARISINSIQDKMRSKRVHLIVMSPASATFTPSENWKTSNPAGIRDWVNRASDRSIVRTPVLEAMDSVRASIEPVSTQSVEVEETLRVAIRLFKRHRDMCVYRGHLSAEEQPISIILVTLMTTCYEGLADLIDDSSRMPFVHVVDSLIAMAELLPEMIPKFPDLGYYLVNPTVVDENFAERWNTDNGERAAAFRTWCGLLQADLAAIAALSDPEKIMAKTLEVFGCTAAGSPNGGNGNNNSGQRVIPSAPSPAPRTSGLA